MNGYYPWSDMAFPSRSIFLFEHDLFRKTGTRFSGSCSSISHSASVGSIPTKVPAPAYPGGVVGIAGQARDQRAFLDAGAHGEERGEQRRSSERGRSALADK
jgi:hypothetical protein